MVSPKAQEGKLNPRTEKLLQKAPGKSVEKQVAPPPVSVLDPYAELYLVGTKGWPLELDTVAADWGPLCIRARPTENLLSPNLWPSRLPG